MMISYKSRFLTRGEVWFDSKPGDTGSVDWILYHQRSRPVPGARTKYFFTYAIDLAQGREQLTGRLHKDTAAKIRRAERDKIVCENCDPRNKEVINRFEETYNSFARMKGLAPLNRSRTENMAASGCLELRVAKDPQGNTLVYHANYCDDGRVTGLESISLFRQHEDSTIRNMIGRANRYLVWSDILRYQEQGLKLFDFGGWYQGTDQAMLKINEFKSGFGGQVLQEYQCEQILTFKGWLVLTIANLLKRSKLLVSQPDIPPGSILPEFTSDQATLPTN